jgi:hypothetical protein
MRKLIVLLIATAFCAATYAAPPTEDSINALMAAANTRKLIENFLTYVTQSIQKGMYASFEGQTLSEAQKRTLDAIPAKFEKEIRDQMSWDKLRPQYVQIYQETFTQKEVDGLIAFYKSPTGAAFVSKMPVLMQKSQALMQDRVAPLAEKVNAAMAKAVEEARAAK